MDGSGSVLPKAAVRFVQGLPGAGGPLTVWPINAGVAAGVTASHHEASPPHRTAEVSLQHGSWGPTASDSREPRGNPSASKVTCVISLVGLTQTGRDDQDHDCYWASSLGPT